MKNEDKLSKPVSVGCGVDCGGGCFLKAYIQEGAVKKLETDDGKEPQYRACVRGWGWRKTIYDPDRLRYPMKRTGERGEGKFERTTWDEALDTVAKELRRIKNSYGPTAILNVALAGGGVARLNAGWVFGVSTRFFNLFGGQMQFVGDPSAGAAEVASFYTLGDQFVTGNDRRDLLNSRLIILWGWNPAVVIFENITSLILAQAKESGAKIICVEPRYTESAAAFADQWIPIIPGTDTALMVAMAYVMIKEGLQNQLFLDKYTLGFDKFKDYVLGKEDGIPKTPPWAESITGVKASTIINLARDYATIKPGALHIGYGVQRSFCGEQALRAGITLASMTGNIGVPGGNAPGLGSIPYAEIGALPSLSNVNNKCIPMAKVADAILLGKAGGYPDDIKMLYVNKTNFLNQMPNVNKTIEAFKKPEFIVVQDIFMTPTAKFADILLPVNTGFEREDIFVQWRGGQDCFYAHKVIGSLYESKTDLEIFTELANRLGFGPQFNDKTEEGWLREFVKESKIPDFDKFREEGVYKFPPQEPFISYRKQVEDPENNPFPTPSGKIEIYSKRLEDMNQPDTIPAIPKYIETWESRTDPLIKKYPLQLITPHPKNRAHSSLATNPWLKEVEPHEMWINTSDAMDRGIKSGDEVKVFNDRGTLVIRAKVTERIVPGVVSINEGTWFKPDKEGIDRGGCANVLTKDESTVGIILESAEKSFIGEYPTIGFGHTTNTCLVQVEKL